MHAAAIIDASANNIPTSYDATAGSLAIANCPSGGVLTIINTTTTVLAVVAGVYKGGTLPTSTLPQRSLFIPAAPTGGSGVAVWDHFKVTKGDSVYIRSTSGSAISTGKVYISIL